MKSSRVAFWLMAGLALLAPPVAKGQDEPDLARERRLHKEFQLYKSMPTSPEKWQAALGAQTDTTYSIEKGDTLWDISDTFFGDPDFWPKIWALNKEGIFNPHEITPGEKIQFVPGTLNEPPSVEVIAAVAEPEAPAAKPVEGTPAEPEEVEETQKEKGPVFVDLDLSTIKLPKQSKRIKPGAAMPPKSLPKWGFRSEQPASIFAIKPIERNVGQAEMDVHYYLEENFPDAVGKVMEAEAGMTLAHENQYVVIKAEGAAPGQTYLIRREKGSLKSPRSGTTGTITEIMGALQVREIVNSSKQLYRAVITEAFVPIELGSELIPGTVPRVEVNPGGDSVDAPGTVIGGAFTRDRNLFGPGEILFLGSGSQDGIVAGQTLNVYRIEKIRDEDSNIEENPRRIGSVRIVKVTPAFATAVVVTAVEEIWVGDSTSHNSQVQ